MGVKGGDSDAARNLRETQLVILGTTAVVSLQANLQIKSSCENETSVPD